MPLRFLHDDPSGGLAWLAIPMVAVLGVLVAMFVIVYSVTILPILLLYRWITKPSSTQ